MLRRAMKCDIQQQNNINPNTDPTDRVVVQQLPLSMLRHKLILWLFCKLTLRQLMISEY